MKDVYEDHTIYNRRLFLHYADLEDTTALRRILQRVQPDELYHLAGQSHVGLSFEIPETTCEFTAMATMRLLEILRDLPRIPKPLHASSSEIFGQPTTMPQTEESPIILQRNADQKAYRYDHGPLVARKGAKESGKPIVCILLCPLGAACQKGNDKGN